MGLLDLQNHQLKSFLTVADSRSISSAAEKLFISHTSLIQQMNALESSLGFSLFIRSPRGVVLTESGKTFYEEFQKLILQADDLITKCRAIEEHGSHIRVANMNDLHTFYFYSEFYRQFQKDNPKISIDFVPTTSESVLEMCIAGDIDIGFYFGLAKQADHPSLVFRTSTISNMCIVVSQLNPLAKKGFIEASDLTEKDVYAFNVSDPDLIYRQVPAIEAGRLHLFDATMQTVFEKCENNSLIILPIWFKEHFPTLSFLPFEPPIPFSYQVVYRKDHNVSVQMLVNSYLEFDSKL